MTLFVVTSKGSHEDGAQLAHSAVDCTVLSLEDIISTADVTFADGGHSLSTGDGVEQALAGATVWYNPHSFETLPIGLSRSSDSDWAFAARQYEALLLYFESWIERNSNCIDAPSNQRLWSNKLRQLSLLAEHFPNCLIPSQATAMVAPRHAGKVIKHLSESRMLDARTAFYARLLNNHAFGSGKSQAVPMLLQDFIDASHEFRTFYFGGPTATVITGRTAQCDGIVDMHYYPSSTTEPVSGQIFEAASSFWKRLSKELSLTFFAADYFVVDGIPKLLEINPLFTWSWMPESCSDEVIDAMTRYVQSNNH